MRHVYNLNWFHRILCLLPCMLTRVAGQNDRYYTPTVHTMEWVIILCCWLFICGLRTHYATHHILYTSYRCRGMMRGRVTFAGDDRFFFSLLRNAVVPANERERDCKTVRTLENISAKNARKHKQYDRLRAQLLAVVVFFFLYIYKIQGRNRKLHCEQRDGRLVFSSGTRSRFFDGFFFSRHNNHLPRVFQNTSDSQSFSR